MLQQNSEKRGYTLAFFLSILCAACFILPGFLLGGGTFYMGADYNYQQVPFNMACNAAVKSGNFLWADTFDLGTSFVGAYSFYTLGSPFFWLSLLLPAAATQLVLPFLLILKFGVAGLTAYAWLRRNVKTQNAALLGALLYAFSSYQIANLNYNHFHDVTALFPLLLLTLDLAMEEDRRWVFALAVALSALTNYFFFVGEVVFLCLYFGVKLMCGAYKLTLRRFGRLAMESVLGTGLAAVLLLPSILFIFSNPRTSESIVTLPVWRWFLYKPHQYADLLHSVLLPAESIMNRAFVLEANPTAPEMWLPLVGVIPAVAWCWNKRKTWLAKLIFVCGIFAAVPLLNSLFVGLNAEYYSRWLYMPVLLLALATAHFAEQPQVSLRPGLWFAAVCTALFLGCYLLWRFYFQVEFLPNRLLAYAMILLAVAGLVCTLLLRKFWGKKAGTALVLASVMGFAVFSGFLNVYYTQKGWTQDNANLPIAPFYETAPQLRYPNEQYSRVDTLQTWLNTGLVSPKPSMNLFGSTVSGSIMDFYHACGYSRTVNSVLPYSEYGIRSLFSVQYVLHKPFTYWLPPSQDIGMQKIDTQNGIEIYENENYIPMAFTFDFSMSENQFANSTQKHLALNRALVLSEAQRNTYAALLPQISDADLQSLTYETYREDVAKRRASAAQNVSYQKGSYTAEITLERENLVFFSVPFDKGWSASVNGKSSPIEKVDIGFMAVPAPTGQSKIVLTYFPQGLRLGIGISLCSALVLLTMVILRKKEKKYHAETASKTE